VADYLLQEDGASHVLLEDGTGAVLLEESGDIPVTPGVATWGFVLTDISTGAELADITGAVLTAKIAPRLNRPLTVQLELPADDPDIRAAAADGDPNLTVGTRSVKAYRNGVLRANVIVWQLSYSGDADTARVSVTGYDPLVQLRRRPARDATGDFSNPEFGDSTEAGDLVKGIVDNTIVWEGDLLIDTDAGTCDASTALGGNLGGWPMMIFDLLTTVTDTGVVDVVLEPLDGTAGKLAVLNAVDTWGEDRTASVSFDYATGDYSVAEARRIVDMDDMANKLWMYLGPKIDIQHWRGNITGHDAASTAKYGVYMDIHIYDSGQENASRDLFQQLWATELQLRKVPAELLYVTPQTGRAADPFDDYGIGDLVTLNLGDVFGPPITGVQRIYGFDCDVDADGVERVSELIVSAQGE
jgi:hypothetical protein